MCSSDLGLLLAQHYPFTLSGVVMAGKLKVRLEMSQTENKHARLKITRTLLALLLATQLSGCQNTGGYVQTERSICRELARDLPSYSTKDTPETLESGARFIDVFNAVCPK